MKNTISKIIKSVRKKQGLTQREFGGLIGKERYEVSKYEVGTAMIPGDTFLKILMLDRRIVTLLKKIGNGK